MTENNKIQENNFWQVAEKYTSSGNEDEPFTNEMAYMMVTLHRTGN